MSLAIDNKLPDASDPLRGRIFPHAETEVVRLSEAEIDRWLATPIDTPDNLKSYVRREHVRNCTSAATAFRASGPVI